MLVKQNKNEKLTYIQLVNIVDTFLRCFFLLIGGQLSRCYGRNWWNSESTVDPYRDWDRTEKMWPSYPSFESSNSLLLLGIYADGKS